MRMDSLCLLCSLGDDPRLYFGIGKTLKLALYDLIDDYVGDERHDV